MPRSHRKNVAGAFLERWKKISTARNRSPPLKRSWAPLWHRRIRSATADGPSYRSESFELHKILRAVRSGQFSAPAKFTNAPTTPSQSLAPLDESSRTLGSARPTQKSWTLNNRCFTSFARAVIKRCTNFGGAVVSVLRANTGLLERCRALKQRSTAMMNFGLALVWRCYSGTRIWLLITGEMDQAPIWNRTALSANCTTMNAERLAAIGALVQQQNQNYYFLS